jgi:peptide/nickel transport system ATP-binding protein
VTVAALTGVESSPALQADDLVVDVRTPAGWRSVVRGVSVALNRGEITALVGETGSGKTMTALALIDLLPPAARRRRGRIRLGGNDISSLSGPALSRIRGRRVSMIFQDPMTALNPVLTVGFQVTEPMRTHLRLGRREAMARAADLLAQLGMPDVERTLRRYPHELSGGMRQRALIAVGLACDPEVLLADEPTTALDVTVQAQILDLIREQVDRRGLAVLLVTHSLGVAAQVADRTEVMYGGAIVESGPTDRLLSRPNHPYSKGLIGCIPRLDTRVRPLPTLPGSASGVWQLEAGCRFAPRCTHAVDRCRAYEPGLEPVSDGQRSACWVFAAPGRESGG